MASIGLYDVDLNHGTSFNISLPLMKAYTKLIEQGHLVVMMNPYEKTGRFNKVLYFKDSPKLALPKGIVIDSSKSSFYGYGFYGNSTLMDDTKEYSPSFVPYDNVLTKVKNIPLYQKIKNNSLIDWREKDFTGARKGAGYTYVNDRDFLKEDDWEELFQHYDNNIEFVHSLNPSSHEQAAALLELYQGKNSRINIPYTTQMDLLLYYLTFTNTYFICPSIEDKFLLILAAKTLSDEPIFFSNTWGAANQFEKDLNLWARSRDRTSFKDFKGKDFEENNYLKFRYRILLKQDPKKITYNELRTDYLTSR